MIRFENGSDFIEIEASEESPDGLSSNGDAYLSLVVFSQGFRGHNDLWILGSDLQIFCGGLRELEKKRQGEAMLNSISPNELRLVVRSVDSRGHMLVEGSSGYHVQRENCRAWHAVSFGFEFDPSQLARAVKVGWVRRYGEG